MTSLSDDVAPPDGGICAPQDTPGSKRADVAIGYEPRSGPVQHVHVQQQYSYHPVSHSPGKIDGIAPILKELSAIATDMRHLNFTWEGPASQQYGRTWAAIRRELHALSAEVEAADVVRKRRISALEAEWDHQRRQALATGQVVVIPPYPWM